MYTKQGKPFYYNNHTTKFSIVNNKNLRDIIQFTKIKNIKLIVTDDKVLKWELQQKTNATVSTIDACQGLQSKKTLVILRTPHLSISEPAARLVIWTRASEHL